jgi:hypothetical protein
MRPIILILLCASVAHAVTPAKIQACKSVNGGVAKQNYIVTIGSSGGSTGCTSDFTTFDAILIGYEQQTGASDRATGNLSVTGATITWHKAASLQNGIFAPPGHWTGIMYACGSDITSPTNSIQITMDMGSSQAGWTALYAEEVSNINQTSCLDKTQTISACCSGAQVATALSGTLASASEYAFAAAMTETGTNPVIAAGSGGACASSCLGGGFNAIGAQEIDNQSTTSTAIEGVAVSSTTSGTWAINQSPTATAQNIVGASFLSSPPPSTGHGPKGKIL